MFLTKNIARRSAIVFLIWGLAWIITGDAVVTWVAGKLALSVNTITIIEIAKGVVFVCIAAFIIFIVIKNGVGQLKSSRKEYKDLFRHNPVAMIVFSIGSGKILAVNVLACKQYGYSESEFLQMNISSIRTKYDAAELQKQIAADLNTIADIGTWKHVRKNREEFWVHLFACKTTFKRFEARLVLAFDVDTEMNNQRRLEIQNQKLANLSWFHSHELRAHIARIQGLLGLVNYNDLSDQTNAEILNRLKITSESLDELIKYTSRTSFLTGDEPNRVA